MGIATGSKWCGDHREWERAAVRASRHPAYTGEHKLTETEDYFGPLFCIRETGSEYDRRYVLRPCKTDEESNAGTGNLYRQHCACGWAGSWSQSMTAAINGGKAHRRAAEGKS